MLISHQRWYNFKSVENYDIKIHTKKLAKKLKNVNLNQIAKETKNYTGAELMTLVESAKKFAIGRVKHINDFTSTNKVKVEDL